MLDLKLIRENPGLVKQAAANKSEKCDIDGILELDRKRRDLIGAKEALEAQKNKASKEIAVAKKEGRDAAEAIIKMREVADNIDKLSDLLKEVEAELDKALLTVPNIPYHDVPVGKDETANKIIRQGGEIREFDFQVRPHWEIGEIIGALDIPRGVRVSGWDFIR